MGAIFTNAVEYLRALLHEENDLMIFCHYHIILIGIASLLNIGYGSTALNQYLSGLILDKSLYNVASR